MVLLKDLLKVVENEVTMFAVCTRHSGTAHKYLVTDGLVHYPTEDGDRITPSEALERFRVDLPMFEVMAAEVSRRTPSEDGRRGYIWTHVERVDEYIDPRLVRIAELEAELAELKSQI